MGVNVVVTEISLKAQDSTSIRSPTQDMTHRTLKYVL
jgi:hypothetical protein